MISPKTQIIFCVLKHDLCFNCVFEFFICVLPDIRCVLEMRVKLMRFQCVFKIENTDDETTVF